MTGTAIIGREGELAALRAFVGRVDEGSGALLLDGDAGAGKTTLWEAALDHARELGLDVRAARPLEAEAKLAFAALGDLLAGVEDAVDALPEPQAHALRVALLLEPAGDAAADERAVGLAVVGVLRRLAAERAVVVGVDDIQWLDAPSARALAFAVRRIDSAPIRFLFALRRAERARLVFDPERALPSLVRLEVDTLDLDATHRLIADRVAASLPRATVRSLHDTSGGNPLFALELAGVLAAQPDGHVPGGVLRVPTSLHDLVGSRIEALPLPTRDALAAAAALGRPTPTLVGATVDGDIGALLAPAVDARVIEPVDDQVRFVHPLLAAAAYQACSPARRRALHRALATAADEQAVALRCRGLLAGVHGDGDAAVSCLERALDIHTALRIPFDEGRTLLALGAARRRANERRAARATLERALATFEGIGARVWAARAQQELARIGGRTPAGDELTPVERRVAELVAAGRTNREVASTLFLSPRTVEGHLSRVYAKLGVRSRVELARSFESR